MRPQWIHRRPATWVIITLPVQHENASFSANQRACRVLSCAARSSPRLTRLGATPTTGYPDKQSKLLRNRLTAWLCRCTDILLQRLYAWKHADIPDDCRTPCTMFLTYCLNAKSSRSARGVEQAEFNGNVDSDNNHGDTGMAGLVGAVRRKLFR